MEIADTTTEPYQLTPRLIDALQVAIEAFTELLGTHHDALPEFEAAELTDTYWTLQRLANPDHPKTMGCRS